MRLFRSSIFYLLLGLLAGLGLGLVYSWQISPVTYVDANPAILRADFKDQYRIVIAAAYASTHDLPRARARLELLSDTDPVGELSAQAQRMLAGGESTENVQPLAQLAADLQQGYASISLPTTPVTNEPSFASTPFTAVSSTPDLGSSSRLEEDHSNSTRNFQSNLSLGHCRLSKLRLCRSKFPPPHRVPQSTPTKGIDTPFTLVGQDTVCDANLEPGLLQFTLMDSRRKQVAGIQIIVTWARVRTTSSPDSSLSLGTATQISSCRQTPFTASAWWTAVPSSQISPRRPAPTKTAQVTSAGCCSPSSSLN